VSVVATPVAQLLQCQLFPTRGCKTNPHSVVRNLGLQQDGLFPTRGCKAKSRPSL
jgi:hypothetical protein